MFHRSAIKFLVAAAAFVQLCGGQPLPRDVLRHEDGGLSTERATAEVNIIRVTNLYLVDTDTGKDLMEITNGTTYDILKVGTNLTIRAETTDKNGCGWVVFNLDEGTLQHTDLNSPFTLAGNDTDGSLFPSSTLAQVGSHSLKVTPSVDGSLLDVPVELTTLPINENRPANFKSCWNIKEFKGVDIDGTPVVPDDTTTTTTSESTASVTESSEGGLLSRLSNIVKDSALSVFAGQSGRRLKQTHYKDLFEKRRAQAADVETAAIDDGSMYITFFATVGQKTMAPTAAPPPNYDVSGYSSTSAGTIQGNFKIWNKLTLGFVGPATSELGSSERGPYGPLGSFKDFRVDVTFQHVGTGSKFVVPGYFSLDGDAANSIGKSQEGSVWLVHFVPNLPGDWTWIATFRQGENCAPNGGGESGGYFDGTTGTFFVDVADPTETLDAGDLRKKGKLQYIGKHQLQFAGNEEYFVQAGSDSPQNMLAYTDFDDTPNKGNLKKTFAAHEANYVAGNPTWALGNGTSIIGAINYLASTGVNIISVTALTIDGPDGNVYPFNDPKSSKVNYDCSKLAQWGVVFDWAASKGLALRFKFNDASSDDFLDGGATAEERKTFYREMIARYGHHLGVIWDLGEDISDVAEIKARSDYIRKIDPYSSPILVQSAAKTQDTVYKAIVGIPTIEIISVSSSSYIDIGSLTSTWIKSSEKAGRPLVVTAEGDATSTPLWVSILSGGGGSQYYFGATDDLALQDFTTKSAALKEAGYALSFLATNKISVADGTSTIDAGYISLSTASAVVTYKLPGTATLLVDLPGTSSYSVSWFNPATGTTTAGTAVKGGNDVILGTPPTSPEAAWVALLKAA